jgi:SpoVK/Ycf46/Vps4 family AAA+-type ATPase
MPKTLPKKLNEEEPQKPEQKPTKLKPLPFETTSWIGDLLVKRLCQRTNVFLCETFDMKRLVQLKHKIAPREGIGLFEEALGEFNNSLHYSVLRQEIRRLSDGAAIASEGPISDPVKDLDNFLLSTRTIAVISWVFNQDQAAALQNMLAAWSQDDLLYKNKSTVIVFTANAELFSESLRRLCYTITIPPSTPQEVVEVLDMTASGIEESVMKKYGDKIQVDVTDEVKQACYGLDTHSIETAAMESYRTQLKFAVNAFTDFKVRILRNSGLEYIPPTIDFSYLGGYNTLKTFMRNSVILPLKSPDKAAYYGLSTPRGIILAGYPGTGKSRMSQGLSGELQLPMVKLTPADLFRGIVGESESRVKQLTMLIESLSPIVVHIDEIDQLALKRGAVMMTDSGVNRRITNMLLDWLGQPNRKSFLVGCTNLIESMDEAFLRAGRVDEIYLVLPPDEVARKEILLVHATKVRKLPFAPNEDVNAMMTQIAKPTFMWTGAELEKLCISAARAAFEEGAKFVTIEHYHAAIKNVELNIQERTNSVNRMVATISKIENVNKKALQEALKEFKSGESDQSRLQGFAEAL